MSIILKNNQNIAKEVPTGFSWTTLFFGFFVPLFRGDGINCLLMLILPWVTLGLSSIIFPFVYNRMYIKKLLEQGYAPADKKAEMYMIVKGLIIATGDVSTFAVKNTSKNEDIAQKIEELSALKEKGIITEQEYNKQKSKIINS